MIPHAMTFHPLTSFEPPSTTDIDWDLLMLLARTEAAMRWPEDSERDSDDPDDPAPEGLDLRHHWDLDWVSRLAAKA
jgi:hypothetical protein